MNPLWAATADASEVDSQERGDVAREMARFEGAVLLATCHRAELYGTGDAPRLAQTRVIRGRDAVEHVMRVASGLESVIVGEDEVLHQVREALAAAPTGDRRIRRLFQSAIATGRRARSGRTASSGTLAHRAVAWLQAKTDLSGRMVLVAGAGRMGATLAHSLNVLGVDVVIASRDARRAEALAGVYGGRGLSLDAGARLTHEASAVAVALAGPWSELARVSEPNLPPIADISAPQSVPDEVRARMNGNFLGIDDLYRIEDEPRQSGRLPGAYIKEAERLIARATAEYMAWLERTS